MTDDTAHTSDASTATETDDPIEAAELSVPVDAPQHECRYCDRVFARERHRDLHHGQAHPDRVDETAAAAYRSAVESEWESLVRYRYVALGTLVVLYFGFLVAFAVVGI